VKIFSSLLPPTKSPSSTRLLAGLTGPTIMVAADARENLRHFSAMEKISDVLCARVLTYNFWCATKTTQYVEIQMAR